MLASGDHEEHAPYLFLQISQHHILTKKLENLSLIKDYREGRVSKYDNSISSNRNLCSQWLTEHEG